MTRIDVTADHPTPLPVVPRPHHDETLAAYLRRLAVANHLLPSYLRKYLCAPPDYTGSVRAPRLAILTNRSIDALAHTFPDLRPTPRQPTGTRSRKAAHQTKVKLYEEIRREAQTNHSIRSLTAMFGVRSNAIIRALVTSPTPTPTQVLPKRNPILEPFAPLIDELLTTQPSLSRWQIWQTLIDEHNAEVSYSTVRDYVNRKHRQANVPAGQID